MAEAMTSKQRFLTAMTNGRPDRVPCTPDFSNMIPCRLTGRPFWDIYLYGDPPLWRAYIKAASYFGIDPWFQDARLGYRYPDNGVSRESTIVSRDDERIVQQTRIDTPAGRMLAEQTYYRGDPPTPTKKIITDLTSQMDQIPYVLPMPTGYDTDSAKQMKAELDAAFAGDEVAFGTAVGYPGFQSWFYMFEGGVEALTYLAVDQPELLYELREHHERVICKQVEMIIDSRMFDYVLLGASGSITLASPALFDRYALPTIRKVTRMCKQAGLPTMLHSCGKQMHLLKRCAEDTDLDCANPLEIPPMGDCTLAEAKRLYGEKLALMGNLHTTDVMLSGTVEQVKAAARQAIDDAGAGGGFILSTGDQCGRDTPDENIFAMVEVCRTYGVYQ